jgi:hypothetical protein
MPPIAHAARLAAGIAVVAAVSGCSVAAAPARTPGTTTARTTQKASISPQAQKAHGSATAGVDHWTAVARRHYAAEKHGGVAFGTLHRLGKDATLLRLLQSGNLSATQAYVKRHYKDVWYRWHVSRMRIFEGSRMVVDEGVPFCVDGPRMTLRAGGRTLGTLQISIQDEIGLVRLMSHNTPADVVVRGRTEVRSSLPAATNAKLPARGQVTIAGARYQVRSFNETALGGEPVTVWILLKG